MDQTKAEDIAAAYTAAWNSRSPEAVASFFAEECHFIINRGEPWTGRSGVAEMAAGFFADVPDLVLVCDKVRAAGDHVVFLWTFAGTHSGTGNSLNISGWEEREFDSDNKVKFSLGWYDAELYQAQVDGVEPA